MTPLISVRHLGVTYRSGDQPAPALSGLTFSLGKSERLAVIGESGSGKSTLALAIAGLLPRNTTMEGSIDWPGLGRPPRSGADIGFVFQDSAETLDPVMSVGDQVREVVEAHLGLARPQAKQKAIELLARVRLPEPAALYDAYPHQLSGGQKQRVGIAAAIAGSPILLIADEPTSALDTIVQAEIMALIDRLVSETAMSLLLISHDIALAATHSERIIVIRAGRIEEIGATSQIVPDPRSPYTRALLDFAKGPADDAGRGTVQR